MKNLILIAFLFLSGCSIFSNSDKKFPAIPSTENRVVLDPKALELCATLPIFQGITYEQLAQHYLTIIDLYGQCSIQQLNSVKIIRKLSNLDNP
jgi:hypothetical protein